MAAYVLVLNVLYTNASWHMLSARKDFTELESRITLVLVMPFHLRFEPQPRWKLWRSVDHDCTETHTGTTAASAPGDIVVVVAYPWQGQNAGCDLVVEIAHNVKIYHTPIPYTYLQTSHSMESIHINDNRLQRSTEITTLKQTAGLQVGRALPTFKPASASTTSTHT